LDQPPFPLWPEEQVHVLVRTDPTVLAVTDRRLVVAAGDRLLLDMPVPDLRRAQLDVEQGRPPTLVLVPHDPLHEPQVISVPKDQLERVARLMAIIGRRLDDSD